MDWTHLRVTASPWQFNPSIVRCDDGFILTFRDSPDIQRVRPRLQICRLNSTLEVRKETLQDLSSALAGVNPVSEDYWHADARLFWLGSRLYLSYNHGTWPENPNRMYIAEISPDSLAPIGRVLELHARGFERQHREKNWMCFENAKGQLRIAYTVEPHLILSTEETDRGLDCFPIHCTSTTAFEAAGWSMPRGGTHPVRIGDSLYSAFHEVRGEEYSAYYGSVYEFSATAPFAVTRVSCKEVFVPPPMHDNPFNHVARRVVYPAGACALDDDTLLVSCGLKDCEMALTKVSIRNVFEGSPRVRA